MIVKKNCPKDAKIIFTDTNINITTDGRKHLGADVGSDTYKVQYIWWTHIKKGDFVSVRHNDLRDLTANMLSEVCKDVEIGPKLTPLTGEDLGSRTTNTTNEVRLDIRADGVGERVQQVFLDLRVSDPNACRYLNKPLQQCHLMNEQEKERA